MPPYWKKRISLLLLTLFLYTWQVQDKDLQPDPSPCYGKVSNYSVWLLSEDKQWHRGSAPARCILTCTTPFLVKVALGALGEAAPLQQHPGRPAACATLCTLPCTRETGLVTSWRKTKQRGQSGKPHMLQTAGIPPVSIPGLESPCFSQQHSTHLTCFFFLIESPCKASTCGAKQSRDATKQTQACSESHISFLPSSHSQRMSKKEQEAGNQYSFPRDCSHYPWIHGCLSSGCSS
jgi:hypothetical protein